MKNNLKSSTMKKAVSYSRVSHSSQYENGVSLDAQKAKIEAMAVVQDLELIESIVDGAESAKNLNRPGMQRLIKMVDKKAVDVVIVYKLDRLTRSVKDLGILLELFEKRNVSLVSVEESLDTATAAGRLVINIMVSVAQWEREAIGERTSFALQHLKSQDKRVGQIKYGYKLSDDGVHIEKDDGEQKMIGKMKELRDAGYSYQKVADELNAQGLSTRRGSPWRYQYVASILRFLT